MGTAFTAAYKQASDVVQIHHTMAKRAAEDEEEASLKAGRRPSTPTNGDEILDFEDEYEDEFESEDEIMEAGIDGRPDAEREREEAKGMLKS
jgi:ribosome assembly protein RRB1